MDETRAGWTPEGGPPPVSLSMSSWSGANSFFSISSNSCGKIVSISDQITTEKSRFSSYYYLNEKDEMLERRVEMGFFA